MFLLAVVVLVGLLFTTVANDVWTRFRRGQLDRPRRRPHRAHRVRCAARVAYLYDKEQHLKRLSRLGHDVQDLDAALAAQMLRSAFVADATEAIHASLELDEVVQRVVEQSCRLVGAGAASLRL